MPEAFDTTFPDNMQSKNKGGQTQCGPQQWASLPGVFSPQEDRDVWGLANLFLSLIMWLIHERRMNDRKLGKVRQGSSSPDQTTEAEDRRTDSKSQPWVQAWYPKERRILAGIPWWKAVIGNAHCQLTSEPPIGVMHPIGGSARPFLGTIYWEG